MPSLHSLLSAELSSLEQVTYNKSSMVAVSHALEDLVLEFNLQAEIFVTFQEFRFFQAEKDRYLKLDQQGCELFIFCSQIEEEEVTEFENATFIELTADNPLQKEWDVIVNHPEHSMVLLTKERKDQQQRSGDDFRVFSGILSFEPQVVEEVLAKLETVLEEFNIDYTPPRYSFGSYSPEQEQFNQKVSIFLNQALAELEDKQDYLLQVAQEKAVQEAELQKARELHEQFLPADLPAVEGYSVTSYYRPARHLGGDFYNFVPVEDYLIFYLVDITGHGLDGALLNIFIRDTINNFLLAQKEEISTLPPTDILEFVGQRYRQEGFPADYFVCLALGKIDLSTQEISYANAGIHVPAVVAQQGELELLTNSSLPLSTVVEPTAAEYETEEFKLEAGSKLVLTTDGLIEIENGRERYGSERLQELVRSHSEDSSQKLMAKIKDDLNQFKGANEIEDDLTIVIIEKE